MAHFVHAVAGRLPLSDISNSRSAALPKTQQRISKKPGIVAPSREMTRCFEPVWSKTITLQFLWMPLGPFLLEVSQAHSRLVSIFRSNSNWTISFIKDFGSSWKPATYEAQATPKASLDCVGQRLFLAQPSLHSCIIFQGQGFLWLNRVQDEPFLRCTWLDDSSASLSILPPLNICFDLDETLIFNADVAGASSPLEYVVKEAPHALKDDCPELQPGSNALNPTSRNNIDTPFVRHNVAEFLELICPYFRNVRLATFSVEARAKEIAELLDPDHVSLLKNYRTDPVTGQKPVANTVFARELLLQQGHCLTSEEYGRISSGAIFWLKSLDMLDLPVKGLLQRSIIVDDRCDVWVERNQDNIVKISGPDTPQNIGRYSYLNEIDGGEIGKRILMTLINLELKSTFSPAFTTNQSLVPLPAPVPMTAAPPSGKTAPTVSLSGYPGSPPPPPLALAICPSLRGHFAPPPAALHT
eukprot:RCo031574